MLIFVRFLIAGLLLWPLLGTAQPQCFLDSAASRTLTPRQLGQMRANPMLVHIRKPCAEGAKDTLVQRLDLSYKGRLGQGLQQPWRLGNSAFLVYRSTVHGLGLFSDSSRTYGTGDTVCYAYYRKYSTGYFFADYSETVYGSYTNDSQEPNCDVVLTPRGVAMVARRRITPFTELTASYRALIALFPGDRTVSMLVRYW